MRPKKPVLLYGTIGRERLDALAWVLNLRLACARVTVADTLPERLDAEQCYCAVLVCTRVEAGEQSRAFAAMAERVPTLLVIADGHAHDGIPVEANCTVTAHVGYMAQVAESLHVLLARKRGPRKAADVPFARVERAA